MPPKDPLTIIDGCFLRFPNQDNHRHQLKLHEKTFVFQGKAGKATVVRIDDVIGCHVMRVGDDSKPPAKDSAFFCIYAYHIAAKKGASLKSPGLFRQRHTYIFEVDICASYEQNLKVARKWQSAVLWLLNGHKFDVDNGEVVVPESLPAQRRYLCLVNPKSGPGKSLEIFLERVRPVLSEADISYLLLVTERLNHAREFARNLDLDQWSGIIIISGDGLLHEVYNGLMERKDKERAVKMPIGIIPGGSGNGLARSICHASGEPYLADPILACTLGCVKGRVIPMDLVKIDSPKNIPIYSFLSFGWGIMSDIDIESEKLRSIGEIRFTLWAFWRIFNLRTYSGRVSYLPANRPNLRPTTIKKTSVPSGENPRPRNGSRESAAASEAVKIPKPPPLPKTFTFGNGVGIASSNPAGSTMVNGSSANDSRLLRSRSVLANISQELEERGLLERVGDDSMDRIESSDRDRHVRIVSPPAVPSSGRTVSSGTSDSSTSDNNNISSTGASHSNHDENIYLEPRNVEEDFPSIDDDVPHDWVVEEGRFVIVYSSLQSHLGTKLFIAPQARLDDGVCWLLLIKGDASRRQIASYFINQEVGKHVDLSWVRLIPVKAFRLESFDDSLITVDGEIVQTETLQARVLPSKARILSF